MKLNARILRRAMRLNVYELMYKAIGSFYVWKDNGSDPLTAYRQAIHYDIKGKYSKTSLEHIIYRLVIAQRFTMTGAYKLSEEIIADIYKAADDFRHYDTSLIEPNEVVVIEDIIEALMSVIERLGLSQ